MKRVLNLAVPYENIKFCAKIVETKEMSPFQKYLATLIVTAKNSTWETKPLKDAIEEQLGFNKYNHHLVKNEIIEFAKFNFKKPYSYNEILNQLVRVIDLELVKKIKEKILNQKKYLLLSGQKDEINKEILVPLLAECDIKYSTKEVIKKQPEWHFNAQKLKSKLYSDNAKIDIFSEYLTNKITVNQEIKELFIKENQYVWVAHQMELKIINDHIKIDKALDHKIIDWIHKKILLPDLPTFINNEIAKLKLTKSNEGEKYDDNLLKNIKLKSHHLFDTKFVIDGYNLNLYYYDIEDVFYENKQKYQIMFIRKKTFDIRNSLLIKTNQIDEELFLFFSQSVQNYLLKQILDNKINLLDWSDVELSKYITFSVYKNLSFSGKVFLLNDKKFLAHNFLKKYANQFDQNEINQYQKITKKSHFDIIEQFAYQYKRNQLLFDDWDLEKFFLQKIETMLSYQNQHQSSKEIDTFLQKVKSQINKNFHSQKLFQEAIVHIEKIKKQTIGYSKDEIIALAITLRSKIETEVNKLIPDSKLSFAEKVLKVLDIKVAKKLIKYYKFLSEFAHLKKNILHQKNKLFKVENELKIMFSLQLNATIK